MTARDLTRGRDVPVPRPGVSQPPVTNTYHKATSVRDLRGQRAMEYRETAIFEASL